MNVSFQLTDNVSVIDDVTPDIPDVEHVLDSSDKLDPPLCGVFELSVGEGVMVSDCGCEHLEANGEVLHKIEILLIDP